MLFSRTVLSYVVFNLLASSLNEGFFSFEKQVLPGNLQKATVMAVDAVFVIAGFIIVVGFIAIVVSVVRDCRAACRDFQAGVRDFQECLLDDLINLNHL